MNKNLYGLVFVQTHEACPESFDVFDDGSQVATVTLQWGKMSCKKNNQEIYQRKGEHGWEGRFRNDKERTDWLTDAARHIKAS